MPRFCRSVLAALAVLVLAGRAEAQIRIPYCHRTETQMPSLLEDRDGYLWIGSGNGVLRVLGNEYDFFPPGDGLPPGPVRAIHQGPDGVLYFGTERGLGLRVGDRFRSPPPGSGLRSGPVFAITAGPEGSVLFGHGNGVVELHADGRSEKVGLGLPPGRASVVRSLLRTEDGTLYAGTIGKGVVVLRHGRLSALTTADGLAPGEVLAIHERRDGSLYFGTEGGLSILRGGVLRSPRELRVPIHAIEEGRDGTVYLATPQGLRLGQGAPEDFETLTTAHGLVDEDVHSVLELRDGTVYVGTHGGWCVYQSDLIQSWNREHGLPHGPVHSIAEDADGRLFAGTERGLAMLQGRRWKLLGREHELPAGTIRTMLAEPGGPLLLGVEGGDGGAWAYRDGIARRLPLPGKGAVLAIHRVGSQAVYFGGAAGLFAMRDGRISAIYNEDTVRAIDSSPDGSLWFGTSRHGLIRFKDGVFRAWTRDQGLADDEVVSVEVGRDGRVHAGTIRGLSIFHRGRFRNLTRLDGLTTDLIRCALEGENGLVYVHTDLGVGIVDPEASSGSPAVLRNLLMEDGLVSQEGVEGACFQDGQGRFWLGGARGVTRYDPRKERRRNLPIPRLLGWRLFEEKEGRPLPARGVVPRLSGLDSYHLIFNFAGLDLTTPHHVEYRYRLAGLETEWTLSLERQARYTNLGPGDYRFELQASNRPGVWTAPAALPFKILPPPWWRRPRLLMALSAGVLLASLTLVAGLRVRQLLAIERLRTSLAAELHDHIGTGLTEIAIISELASRRDGGASSELAHVGETARQLVDRMNDIVWLVNPRRDSLHELVARLKSSYAELFARVGVAFHAGDLSSLDGVHLAMAYRENLYALLKEALHNALRHSGCAQVRLDAVLRGRGLEVIVRDDGRGFDPDLPGSGNGLENMRRRAAALGGRLTIESAGGQGTAVRFTGRVREKRALEFKQLPW